MSWSELRIGQLGVEIHAEVRVVVDLFVAEHDELSALGAFDVLLEHIVDHRVDVLVAVLHEHWEAVFDAHLELFEEVRVVEGYYFQVRLFFFLFDPFESLLLRVDAVGEAARLGG